MTELDLYKFVQDKEIDWRGNKLILWLHPTDIQELAELVGAYYLSDGGMEVTLLQHGHVGLELNDICETFDIDPTRIHPKEIQHA